MCLVSGIYSINVYEKKVKLKSKTKKYQERIKREKTSQGDTVFDGYQTFKIKIFLLIINRLNAELRKQITAYEQMCESFDFFF